MRQIPKDVLELALGDRVKVPSDKLQQIEDMAVAARDLTQEIKDQEDVIKQKKKRLALILESDLPDIMGQVGIDHVGVPARGNNPGFDVNVVNDRSANIAAGWEPERKREAYDWLEANGHGDLIKSSLRIDFPREKVEEARAAAELIENKFGVDVEVSESIHPQTMSAWFREACAKHLPLPPLDLIGARIARVAKLKERKPE